MPRGDVKWIRFAINASGGVVPEYDFTNIYFTVKKCAADSDFIFQKSLQRGEIYRIGPGDYAFSIKPEDTNNLLVGDYKFDLQVSYNWSIKETFVGDFTLRPEVTWYANEDYVDPQDPTDIILRIPDDQVIVFTIPDYHHV